MHSHGEAVRKIFVIKNLVVVFLFCCSAIAQTRSYANIDDTLTGWSLCVIGTCSGGGTPGGTGTPTSTIQSINNNPPSLDGASMQLSMVAPSAAPNGTNMLWTKKVGANDSALSLSFDVWIWISANGALAGQFEFDQFIFSQTDNIEYMFGTQCDQLGGVWDTWNQNTGAWVPRTTPCSLSYSTWHHIQETSHRVLGDTNVCSGKPCMYYDTLIIDGVLQSGYADVQPAGTLPGGFTSNVGFQYQFNIKPAGTSGASVAEYLDEANFSFIVAGSTVMNGVTLGGGAVIR